MAPRILVPFDFSPAAERALRWASAYRRVTDGSVVAVHVMTPAYMAAAAGFPAMLPTDDDMEAVQRGLLAAVQAIDPVATVDVREAPAVGPALRELQKELHFDLIVVGTHGRGGITRAVLGSVADDLVRLADCPVVTVRADTKV